MRSSIALQILALEFDMLDTSACMEYGVAPYFAQMTK